MRIGQGSDKALGHEQITVGTVAVSLTPPQGALMAVIRSLGQPICWRDDGTNPTSTTGMKQLSNEILVYNASTAQFKMIRASDATGDADVRVAYYG